MTEWEAAAMRAADLKRLIDTMEDEYDSLRKKILALFDAEGRTSGELLTAQGAIKVRIDERVSTSYDNEQLMERIGRTRFLRVCSVSSEKMKAALQLGVIKPEELEGVCTEARTRHITLRVM